MNGMLDVLGFLSSLGLGAFLGMLTKHYLDKNIKNRELLFHARSKAYSQVIGRLSNFFLEEDTRRLPPLILQTKLHTFFSEALLLASSELGQRIETYVKKLPEFHESLDRKDEEKSEQSHKFLSELAKEISRLMRRELAVR